MKMDDLEEELERFKYEEGVEYVRAKQIAEECDGENSKTIGKMLSQAADRGWVEKWGYSRSVTWRILL